MEASAEPSAYRQLLLAMIAELQANRAVLNGLSIRYSMFRFTGGSFPPQDWCISHMTSYSTPRSWADGCVATEDVKRYLALIEKLNASQLNASSAARPRTLRNRRTITDEFEQTLSDVMSLGTHLESAIRRSLEALEAS